MSDESGFQVRHERMRGDGVELHVARAGSGPPVVLLHGFPEGSRSWRKQIPALAEAGFSVLAPDLRGYGLSDRPGDQSAYHLRHLVGDVAALVRASGHPRAHVVGHDWGGIIAWSFAGEHPELLDRLVILNAPHMELYLRAVASHLPQLLRGWYAAFFQLPWLPEMALSAGDFQAVREMFRKAPRMKGAFPNEEIDAYVADLARPGALKAAIDYYRANMGTGGLTLARRARVSAETLVIWGDHDPALTLRVLDGLEEMAPRVRLHRVHDSGHWVNNEAPDEVNRVMTRFLRAGLSEG